MKDRKGASPVPGPTMMMGVASSAGRRPRPGGGTGRHAPVGSTSSSKRAAEGRVALRWDGIPETQTSNPWTTSHSL